MVLLKHLNQKNIYYTCPCGRRIQLIGYGCHATSDIHLQYIKKMKHKNKYFKPLWTTKEILNKYPIYRAFVIMKYSK